MAIPVQHIPMQPIPQDTAPRGQSFGVAEQRMNSVKVANLTVCLYSSSMIVYLHRLRDRGWPIPKYQLAFKDGVAGNLTLHEERDAVLNRYTRIARLQSPAAATKLDVPPLLDAILVELTAERLVLSGIERHEDVAIARIEDVAQTWVCWFNRHT